MSTLPSASASVNWTNGTRTSASLDAEIGSELTRNIDLVALPFASGVADYPRDLRSDADDDRAPLANRFQQLADRARRLRFRSFFRGHRRLRRCARLRWCSCIDGLRQRY